jgi:abortive infection bacteriophage resistance protein
MSNLKMKDQKKRAVKTRPFGREANILSEKCAKCVIFKRNICPHADQVWLGLNTAHSKAQWAPMCIQKGWL